MNRKDRVYEALRTLYAHQPTRSSVFREFKGFSAEEVAELAEIDRTNASRDLNALAQEGHIERIPGRPVLFAIKSTQANGVSNQPPVKPIQEVSGSSTPSQSERSQALSASVQTGVAVSGFESLIGNDEGLKVAIQQAKAAIIYPPKGLHTLLCGPSGVGKTTLARLMHSFAIELRALPQDAPFVSFNCA
ncbi:MAG TPA: sigma 54-interacting transcriptional regulator, partial [Ktedonobacteraceae bacterium]